MDETSGSSGWLLHNAVSQPTPFFRRVRGCVSIVVEDEEVARTGVALQAGTQTALALPGDVVGTWQRTGELRPHTGVQGRGDGERKTPARSPISLI
jgi:hypothetical protein